MRAPRKRQSPTGGGRRPRRVARAAHSVAIALVLGLAQLLAGVGLALPSVARAQTITYANGTTGERAPDGGISGMATIALDVETLLGDTTFSVTMPDGQVLTGHCLNPNHWAPADGAYPFRAEPQDGGTFLVSVNTQGAERHPIHQSYPNRTFAAPPQNVGRMTWAPRIVERPASATIRFQKLDAEARVAQGAASLMGATFELRYYDGLFDSADELPASPTRAWTLVTRDDGSGHAVADLADPRCVVAGDEPYLDAEGTPTLPAGTLALVELEAGAGYATPSSTPHLARVDAQGHVEPLGTWVGGDDHVSALAVTNRVARGGISVQKRDADLHEARPQGGASFAGIRFGVTNRNDQPVVVGGVSYGPGEAIDGLVLTLDAAGHAETAPNALPVGAYDVCELSGNGSYLASDQVWHVTIGNEGEMVAAGEDGAVEDQVARGAVRLGKVDAETGGSQALGGASLAGARFEVVNEGPGPVVVNDALCPAGAVCLSLTTGPDGTASSGPRALPVGTYRVVEGESPEGYLLNTAWEGRFSLGSDGEVADLTREDARLADQVVRGDFRFTKRSAAGGEVMGGVAFLVTSLSTGEAHVVATDVNGSYDSSAAWNPHSKLVNANDAALRPDGTVDDSLIVDDAGLWFAGASGGGASEQNDGLGALPYDTYRIQELRGAANEGHALSAWHLSVTRDRRLYEMGTVDDARVTLRTELVGPSGDHLACAGSNDRLTDRVEVDGLVPGTTYQLSGELREVVGGSDAGPLLDREGAPVTSTRTFTARDSREEVEVPFELNGSAPAGTIVAYETLAQDGIAVASHRDPADEAQAVVAPTVSTSLNEVPDEALSVAGWLRLDDTVSYQGLIAGLTYELEGTLWNADTGEALSQGGEPLVGRVTFVPASDSGQARVSFVVNRDGLAGTSAVAFERLLRNGVEVAAHADLGDLAQTVLVVGDPNPAPPQPDDADPNDPPIDIAPQVAPTQAPVSATPMDPASPATPNAPASPLAARGATALTAGTGSGHALPSTGGLGPIPGLALMATGTATLLHAAVRAARRRRP